MLWRLELVANYDFETDKEVMALFAKSDKEHLMLSIQSESEGELLAAGLRILADRIEKVEKPDDLVLAAMAELKERLATHRAYPPETKFKKAEQGE